jgi:hypothetical protein
MPPAYTAEQIAKGQAKSNPQSGGTYPRTAINVPAPLLNIGPQNRSRSCA